MQLRFFHQNVFFFKFLALMQSIRDVLLKTIGDNPTSFMRAQIGTVLKVERNLF